jgi:hypothetical protein
MMTCWTYCRDAFLNGARLAVILKKGQQGGAGVPDYRPLGLGLVSASPAPVQVFIILPTFFQVERRALFEQTGKHLCPPCVSGVS